MVTKAVLKPSVNVQGSEMAVEDREVDASL